MNKVLLTASLLALTALQPAAGQEKPGNEVPHPPYIGFAPPYTQWTITMSSRDTTGSEAGSQLQSISGTKDDSLLRIVYAWKGGKSMEIYVDHGRVFQSVSMSRPNEVVVLDPSSPGLNVPRYNESDFPELSWMLAPERFVGTAQAEGRKCYLYEYRSAVEGANGAERIQKVWIDCETLLPIRHDNGSDLMTYKYSAREQKPIIPSEPFRKMIEGYRTAGK